MWDEAFFFDCCFVQPYAGSRHLPVGLTLDLILAILTTLSRIYPH